MNSALLRPALVLAIALTAGVVNAASAQNTASSSTSPDKARCDQLISYFDYYAVGRSENSDGARNHTRIGACVDCTNGRAGEGIETMTALLLRKNFDLPPRDVARFP